GGAVPGGPQGFEAGGFAHEVVLGGELVEALVFRGCERADGPFAAGDGDGVTELHGSSPTTGRSRSIPSGPPTTCKPAGTRAANRYAFPATVTRVPFLSALGV